MTTLERITRVITWLINNSITWALAISGLVLKVSWALRVWVFLLWLSIFMFTLMNIHKTNCKEKHLEYKDLKLAVPAWIDVTLDVLMGCLMAAFGHWFYAALVVVQMLLGNSIHKYEPS